MGIAAAGRRGRGVAMCGQELFVLRLEVADFGAEDLEAAVADHLQIIEGGLALGGEVIAQKEGVDHLECDWLHGA